MIEETIVIPKQGTRGHKICSGCGASVGVRTSKCKCGLDFAKKVKHAITPKTNTESSIVIVQPTNNHQIKGFYRPNSTGNILLTPAGEPPFKLTDFTVEGIKEWAIKVVIEYYRTHSYGRLSVSALEYWSRRYYVCTSLEGKKTEKLILETLNNLADNFNEINS